MAFSSVFCFVLLLVLSSSMVATCQPMCKNKPICALSAAALNGTSPSLPDNMFLLAGQSNMVGRGGVDPKTVTWDGFCPPESCSVPQILRFNQDKKWEIASEPIHKFIDTKKAWGIGPGMPFASTLLAADSCIGVIGLIPCAEGESTIVEWSRGNVYYERILKRARAALNSTSGQLRAMLWYQGESESYSTEEEAAIYKEKLDKFFTDLRSDLNLPMLPIIQVALASGGKYKAEIRQAQLNNTVLQNVGTVDADGLALQDGDELHLNTASQVQLGRKLACAFLQNYTNPAST